MSLEDSQRLLEQSGQAASAGPTQEARQVADRPSLGVASSATSHLGQTGMELLLAASWVGCCHTR